MTTPVYDGETITCLQHVVFQVLQILVVVVGGGPAGCTTALALKRFDPTRSFLLIDDADPTTFKVIVGNSSALFAFWT